MYENGSIYMMIIAKYQHISFILQLLLPFVSYKLNHEIFYQIFVINYGRCGRVKIFNKLIIYHYINMLY